MRHAVEVANYGTKPPSFGIVQWLNEISGSALREHNIDDHSVVVVRLRTRNRRWALQDLNHGRSLRALPDSNPSR
jgi:hypothetical protein